MNRRSFLRHLTDPARHPSAPAAPGGDLTPYAGPLDEAAVVHLLRRAVFGASPFQRAFYVDRQATFAVNRLVDEALVRPLPSPPDWIDSAPPPPEAPPDLREAYDEQNRQWMNATVMGWLDAMRQGGLRERMTLFWHNHFVTEHPSYRLAPYAYRYLTTLRTHALGNFRAFVHAVGTDPAMLLYLNGAQNRRGAPNENYARELLELFTMGPSDAQGQPNYTQQDVEQVARALTGWTVDDQALQSTFQADLFDAGEKTIFGRTGPWGYDDVVDLLFEERAPQIAAFLARKLYRAFVYAVPDEALVTDLAGVFLASDFEIAPVMRTLLASKAFFDTEVRGALIKSPVQLLVGLVKELQGRALPSRLPELWPRYAGQMGQELLNPPNVAGWPGHHEWITNDSLSARWLFGELIVRFLEVEDLFSPVTLAHAVDDAPTPGSVFTLPAALASFFLATPVERVDVITPYGGFGGDLVNHPIPADVADGPPYVLKLAQVFLNGAPWYEWNVEREGAGRVIAQFIQSLQRIPDYQLT